MFRKNYKSIMATFLKAKEDLDVLIKEKAIEIKDLGKKLDDAKDEQSLATHALEQINKIVKP